MMFADHRTATQTPVIIAGEDRQRVLALCTNAKDRGKPERFCAYESPSELLRINGPHQ
jgi:hypothetical protein